MVKNKKIIPSFFCLALLTAISSCYKPKSKDMPEVVKNYYSLKITTNNKEATNYSVNVNDLDRIESGTEVTITNTPGYYKIFQITDNTSKEVLSTNNSISFKMDSNKELKLDFVKSPRFLNESKGNINEKDVVNIILMSGQSNMCGTDDSYNNFSTSEKNEYLSGHNNVRINFNGCIHNNCSTGGFGSGVFGPVVFGQGAQPQYFGPEVGLSKYLGTNDPLTNYYIIKVAWGGSKIADWCPNNSEEKNAWGKLITAVDKCFTNFIIAGKIPSIRTMCWLQGESDSVTSEEFALSYASKFIKFKTSLLNRYKGYISNDFKWISAGISTISPEWIYEDIINEQLRENSDMYIEDSETLPLITPGHYNRNSYLTIGKLFGQYFLD